MYGICLQVVSEIQFATKNIITDMNYSTRTRFKLKLVALCYAYSMSYSTFYYLDWVVIIPCPVSPFSNRVREPYTIAFLVIKLQRQKIPLLIFCNFHILYIYSTLPYDLRSQFNSTSFCVF